MEWSDKHDLVLCREVFMLWNHGYQHPYKSKERGDVWNQIAVNLSGLDHPKIKVNKRSMRDKLPTLLITKHNAKIGKEENATGITCELETELVQALEEITDRKSWPTKKSSEVKKKEKEEGAAREEHRQSAMERLGQTVQRRQRHFEYFVHSQFLCLQGKLVVHSKRALNSRIFPP